MTFTPSLPFPDFKWKWATLQCTEGLNDPVVLLGVLSRMRKLEKLNKNIKYSSEAFAEEMRESSDREWSMDEIDAEIRAARRSRCKAR